MADVKVLDSIPCQFDATGWSPCNQPTDNGWCSKHEKAVCCSCGEKAVRLCDAQMGGLMCGANLCETCKHGSKEHITKEDADKIRIKENEEKEAREVSRTTDVQRINKEFGVPMNLFELFKGGWKNDGYEFTKVYYLELKHGLMGTFPAIFASDTDRIIFTTNLELLERVWLTLDPRPVRIGELSAYVNQNIGILYLETRYPTEREESVPYKLLVTDEFEELTAHEIQPFNWASGLFGGDKETRESFHTSLTKQAITLDPSFKGLELQT